LNRSADATINFDLDLALKASNENPVFYIQNAHVRCAGILRQVAERGYPDDWDADADLSLLCAEETAFVLKMLELPEMLVFAHDTLAPHLIAVWALDLARAFHPLYDQYRVLHSEVPEDVAKARLRLYRAAKVAFKRALTLTGMTAPERM
jgi:arginyl-tRNA synthetase